MTKERMCKKHNVGMIQNTNGKYCPVCSKIKSVKQDIKKFKKEIKESIKEKKKEIKAIKESANSKLGEFDKVISYYESKANEIFENAKKEQEEIDKINISNTDKVAGAV